MNSLPHHLLLSGGLLWLFVTGFCCGCASGQPSESPKLFPILQHDKLGYIDENGNVVIKPQFERVSFNSHDFRSISFSEGLAGVKVGEKWGFIDTSGKIVIAPQFRAVWFFSEGLAQVWIGDKSGYIDKAGKMVIRPQFTGYSPFSEGLAGVSAGGVESGIWGYIDKTGQFAIPPRFVSGGQFSEGLAAASDPQSRGFIDKQGNFVIRFEGEISGGDKFVDGLSRVWASDGSVGFIDKSGNVVIKPERRLILLDFSEGLAVNCTFKGADDIKSFKTVCGYIDQTGKTVIEPLYNSVKPFSEGLAPVCFDNFPVLNRTCGYIDKTGRMVIPMQFDDAYSFHNGLALVIEGDINHQKWGYIDKTGKYVWKPTN